MRRSPLLLRHCHDRTHDRRPGAGSVSVGDDERGEPVSLQAFLDELGGTTIAGVLAIGGIIALVLGVVRLFQPPDDFCAVDLTKRQWTPLQSERYFTEKAKFEQMHAAGNRGLGNSIYFVFAMLLLITVVVAGLLSSATRGQSPTTAVILVAAWVTAIIIIARWIGYRWRRCERYLAFIDGDREWMRSRRLRRR